MGYIPSGIFFITNTPSPKFHNRTDLNTFPTMYAPVPDNSHSILNNDYIIRTLSNTNPAPMAL